MSERYRSIDEVVERDETNEALSDVLDSILEEVDKFKNEQNQGESGDSEKEPEDVLIDESV